MDNRASFKYDVEGLLIDVLPLWAVKDAFYEHFDYLRFKAHLKYAWELYVLNKEKFAEFANGEKVEVAGRDILIWLCQETGEICWDHTQQYHDMQEDWARQMDFALELEQEYQESIANESCQDIELADDIFQDVDLAMAGGAMLRVARTEDGFEVVLRLKDKERSKIRMYTCLATGGLFSEKGYPVLATYEFSMHRYQTDKSLRAATEYVRRKLNKERERVRRAEQWLSSHSSHDAPA